ncbi:uncharacterized protein LOC110870542 [Helianthus annuus]|uniref:uncharacterized protein LOC110870542 n=1 Tax=Helianthus annuus TaxID=4232 RepID=UPI000B8F94AD|nr:uncharacterized protein LOC110870542 [Helianthus annuus]
MGDLLELIYVMWMMLFFIGEWSKENISNLNRIPGFLDFLLCSSLKVNLQKSCIYGSGVTQEDVHSIANLIHGKVGVLPFTFLSLPIRVNMKRVKFWKPIVDKFNFNLFGWKARNLSLTGRVTLAKVVLGALSN